jgi:hypothetical protein
VSKHEWTENHCSQPVLRTDDIPHCDVAEWRIGSAFALTLFALDHCGRLVEVAHLPNVPGNLERLKRLAERMKDVVAEFHAEGGGK